MSCNCINQVKVLVKKIHPNAVVPLFALPLDIGADLYTPERVVIQPHSHELVKTGLIVVIPQGYEGQVRPKSGIALKRGVTVLNTPGTIESTYRGELGVILHNTTDNKVIFEAGDKIAQLIISKVPQVVFEEVDEVDMNTERGDGGFGSTGTR